MTAGLAIIAFYLLLAFAVLVMRGDLTNWPREADRAVAFAICLSAVVLLLRSWSSSRPFAGPADDGSSRPRSTWIWWAGVVGLAAFVFLAALPPVSEALARPLARQRSLDGRDSPGLVPPPPSSDGSVPNRAAHDQASAAGAGDQHVPGEKQDSSLNRPRKSGERLDSPASDVAKPAGAGPPVLPGENEQPTMNRAPEAEKTATPEAMPGQSAGLAAMAARWRELVESRPPWFVALLALFAVGAAGLLWWVLRRYFSRCSHPDDGTTPRPPWHNDPDAPAYVREFRRLCEIQGCPPRPGDTWRDLLGRLPATPEVSSHLEPVADYHYRVRYEGATSDAAAERAYARLIRAARKASTFPPAAETTPAASTTR